MAKQKDIIKIEELICEICNKEPALGVCAVPGVSFSCAYGKACLEANAHPWGILIANTACIGGLEQSAGWWKEMVECTCKHLGKTIEEFNKEVEEDIRKMNEYFERKETENAHRTID
jgi:hypothetical protein